MFSGRLFSMAREAAAHGMRINCSLSKRILEMSSRRFVVQACPRVHFSNRSSNTLNVLLMIQRILF